MRAAIFTFSLLSLPTTRGVWKKFCALFLGSRQQKFSFRKAHTEFSLRQVESSRTIYKPPSYRSRISVRRRVWRHEYRGGKKNFPEDFSLPKKKRAKARRKERKNQFRTFSMMLAEKKKTFFLWAMSEKYQKFHATGSSLGLAVLKFFSSLVVSLHLWKEENRR